MRGPRPYRSGSSSFRLRWIFLVLAWIVLGGLMVGVGVVLVERWQESRELRRVDLGPAPVRGLRLVGPLPVDVDVTCPGVSADLPVVRLVEQVRFDAVTLCLQSDRGPATGDGDGSAAAFRLLRSDGPSAEAALSAFSAAYALPDAVYPWYRDLNNAPCTLMPIPVYPAAVTVGTQSFRAVVPTTWCGPRPETAPAAAGVAELAQPVG